MTRNSHSNDTNTAAGLVWLMRTQIMARGVQKVTVCRSNLHRHSLKGVHVVTQGRSVRVTLPVPRRSWLRTSEAGSDGVG